MKYKLQKLRKADGFTLLETLITFAIVTSLAGIGLIVSIDSYQRSSLRQEHRSIARLYEKARIESMNNVGDSPHGVWIAGNQATLFRGASYLARDPEWDISVPLAQGYQVQGPDLVVFEKGSGQVKNAGKILLSDGTQTLAIDINHEGTIEW